ncbi:MAG TPA: LptF/LptG family permease [Bryobacteraceae bacterium]|nr:LptF/LptG family permease [Bryobacteraceae bacterium]
MWRILNRYVFREILTSALLGTLLATAVIFLQGVGSIFEVLVRSSAKPETILYLFLLSVPPLLPLTIPFGVLVGILIGLGRMSGDGEITAMRAAGVSSRTVITPVLFFAMLATAVAGAASLRLTPLAMRERVRVINKLEATQLSADIQPRVFEEDFPNTILYVGDVRPGPVTLWRNVFIADVTPPEQRTSGLRDKADGPLITVAHEAVAVPDIEHNRIQLSLKDASTHEMGKDGVANDAFFPSGQQALQAQAPSEVHRHPMSEMNTRELIPLSRSGPDWVEARIELHRRLALPLACIVLALVGIPLGASTRKGGKSAGYVNAVFLAFFCYYLAFITLIGLARQRTLPVEVAVWLPNAVFFTAGVAFLARLERPGDRDLLGAVRDRLDRLTGFVESRLLAAPRAPQQQASSFGRTPLLPQIVDTYVLSTFLFYLFLLLASFVSMTEVYNFFELLSDIVKNKIPLIKVFTYLFFLTPTLIYNTLPISVLVAVLVTFGVMTKHNEVTAFKACGVSLHRLALPILLGSGLLSGGLFAFDHYYVPGANRKQDALRNEIKGKPPQSYLRPDRKWIFGRGSRIYYYKYFDQAQQTMAGVSVFELQPETFQLLRQITAERAHWEASLQTWVFENGWNREFDGRRGRPYHKFQVFTFPELNEPPGYFLTEELQDKQMNFRQLEEYIRDLRQRGFDTVKLQVQFYRKFSVPLFALIMAMISIPFGFLVGNRGAMTGIGVSIVIAIAYWGIGTLFEKIGDVNQLPPALAAWSPDALFSLTGLYLLLRMRS